jgi:hypothetical protein
MDSTNGVGSEIPVIGAKNIAREVFKDKLNERQIYRMAEAGGWGFFRVQNKLACLPSVMLGEMARRARASCGKGRPDGNG